MTHSPLTNQIRLSAQSSPREGTKIDSVILHHQAGTNDDSVISSMQRGTRQVSSNYTVNSAGRITCVVDEDRRAWTSGSRTDGGRGAAWDRRSITVEVENSAGAPAWPISPEAAEAVARLLADVHIRYGVPLNRDRVVGHRELWSRHRASYATACPGGMPLDAIVDRARAIVSAGSSTAPAAAPKPVAFAPPFPLPAGAYFGPKSGPVASVSGYFSHREDARVAQRRMQARGYTFPRFGIDGLYGDEWAANIRHFQADKGLHVDGLLGIDTWTALWTTPVT